MTDVGGTGATLGGGDVEDGDEGEEGSAIPTGATSAADSRDGTGVAWDALEIVARGPKRLVPNVILLMVELRRMEGMRTTVQIAAKRLKVTEAVIVDCAAHAPQLLDVTRDGRRIALRTTAPPPWVVDPARAREIERELELDRKKQARAKAQGERDAIDTPFNRLRLAIEGLGMIRDDARAFAGFLTRTYGMERSEAAVEVAARNAPGEPKAYVIKMLKAGSGSLPGARSGGGAARTVFRTARPDMTGRTSLIGWEDCLVGGVRNKLYRLPNGTLRREAPATGEAVPGLDEDPGFRVAG